MQTGPRMRKTAEYGGVNGMVEGEYIESPSLSRRYHDGHQI